jgi:hypothetical protein
MRRPRPDLLAASAFAVFLAACGDSTGSNDPLPNNAATAVGLTVHDNVEASLDALFPARLLQPFSTGPADDPCVTPSSTTDADGDGVPDDATYNFTAPPCRFNPVRDFTLDVVGQLRLVDLVPETAGFGADITLTGLRFEFSAEDPDQDYTLVRNGRMILTGSTAGLQVLTQGLQVQRSFTGLGDAFVDLDWQVGFTPEATLAINQPLPSGAVSVGGTVGWSRGDEEFDLTVTTATPLHYDASCDAAGQRLDEGELHVSGTFGDVPGHVRITWTDCGTDPDIEFVEE